MKAVIFCAAGMSTSFLVSSTQKAAKARKVELEFDAFPESQIKKYLGKTDLVLLGPQISYQRDAVREMYAPYHTPVEVVPLKAYGLMDGNAVLDLILRILQKKEE